MNNSALIVHSTNHQIYCCCYCWETVVCSASNKTLQLWDILSGAKISNYDYGQQLAPISIHIVSQQQSRVRFLLQDKSGKILIIECKSVLELSLVAEYQIQTIGFTKLPILMYLFDEGGKVIKQKSPFFCTVCKGSEIEKRDIMKGTVISRFSREDHKFADVTAMLQLRIQGSTYFFIAEQGNAIKRVELGDSDNEGDLYLQKMQTVELQSSQEIKIILQLEPIDDYRAIAVLRQDRLVIINLKELTVETNLLKLNFVRMIKGFKKGLGLAFSGKKRIGVIQNGKVIKNQPVHTELIMDIDVCQWGIVGVTQQGKLIALPL